MDLPPELPPILAPVDSGHPTETTAPPPIPRWRGWVLLLLMAAYPLSLGLIGAASQKGVTEPEAMLPDTVLGLWKSAGANFGIFAVFFGVAWAIARPGTERLFLKPRNPWATLGLGVAWSIGLRILVAVMVVAAIGAMWAWSTAHGRTADDLGGFRPKIENVISPAALHDPVYLLTVLTVISFVVAGLREELWRAAMIAGVVLVLPVRWQGRRGEILAVALGSIVFGLGHLPQGMGGVFLTGVLGIGLGGILIGHRSLWIAVLAHGFFDATSFLGLWAVDRAGLLKQFLAS